MKPEFICFCDKQIKSRSGCRRLIYGHTNENIMVKSTEQYKFIKRVDLFLMTVHGLECIILMLFNKYETAYCKRTDLNLN